MWWRDLCIAPYWRWIVAGEYSCLRVDLLFARQLSFFLVTVYVPCSMTVSVSWMSFWLDHKAVSRQQCKPLASWDKLNSAGPCPGSPGRDDPAGHVHHPGQHPELPAPCGLHQGYWCVVRSMRLLRVQRSARVCSGKLCFQVIIRKVTKFSGSLLLVFVFSWSVIWK